MLNFTLFAKWTEQEQKVRFELKRYAYIGDIDKLRRLSKENTISKIQLSEAVLKAGFKNHEKIVKYLVSLGADINFHSISGRNILMYSVQNKNLNLVKYLLKHGSKIERSNDGYDVFFTAILYRDYEMFKFLLPYCKNFERYYYVKGDYEREVKTTMLLTAIQNGTNEIAKLLIQKGVDIQSKNGVGESPLLCAMRNKEYGIVSLLLRKNADTSVVDIEGNSLFTYALADKKTDLALQALQNKKFDIHQWIESSVFKGHHPLYEYYISESREEWKIYNLLHMASFHNMPKVVEKLLELGLDIDTLNKGDTLRLDALGLSAINGATKSSEVLLKNKANPYKIYRNSKPEGFYGLYYYGGLSSAYTLLSLAAISQHKSDKFIEKLLNLKDSKKYVKNETYFFYLNLLPLVDSKGEKSIYGGVLKFLRKHNFSNYKQLDDKYKAFKKDKEKKRGKTKVRKEKKWTQKVDEAIKNNNLKSMFKKNVLTYAIIYKRYYLLEDFLKLSANPNELWSKQTPSQTAAQSIKDGKVLLKVLRLLKRYGADINKVQTKGYEYRKTPLLIYLENNEIDNGVVNELVKIGASLGNDNYALKKIFNIYSDVRFEYIIGDSIFSSELNKLYSKQSVQSLTDIVISIIKNKRRSNYRVERILRYAYFNNKILNYNKILKNLNKKDNIYKMIKYYRKL